MIRAREPDASREAGREGCHFIHASPLRRIRRAAASAAASIVPIRPAPCGARRRSTERGSASRDPGTFRSVRPLPAAARTGAPYARASQSCPRNKVHVHPACRDPPSSPLPPTRSFRDEPSRGIRASLCDARASVCRARGAWPLDESGPGYSRFP